VTHADPLGSGARTWSADARGVRAASATEERHAESRGREDPADRHPAASRSPVVELAYLGWWSLSRSPVASVQRRWLLRRRRRQERVPADGPSSCPYRPSMSRPSVMRSPHVLPSPVVAREQLLHVPEVEAILIGRSRRGEGFFELGQWIPSTLGMGVV